MIKAQDILFNTVQQALSELYSITTGNIIFQKTRKEFEGDFTLVTFPYIKEAKKSPELMGKELGDYLVQHNTSVKAFNVVKGFLNISLNDAFWLDYFNGIKNTAAIGCKAANSSGRKVMLEYSSPNTNKPLHLGHVRNNLLGYSVAQILKANGHTVYKTNIVNDRGIHICKSMLAWQKFGNGETPQSSGMKGDHLVGKYYVEFEKKNQIEALKKLIDLTNNPIGIGIDGIEKFIDLGKNPNPHLQVLILKAKELLKSKGIEHQQQSTFKEVIKAVIRLLNSEIDNKVKWEDYKGDFEDYFLLNTDLMNEAREMLRQWEAGNTEVVNLWKMMNSWVYEGFDVTYKELGVDFDKTYYESNTYLLGKEVVQEGLAKGVFYKKENGSVAIDLTKDGLDEKIVLRADGTSVYITQDLGTAIERFKEFEGLNQLIYTVGNEQDYHFKVLFLILAKLGYTWAKECYHLSYGMVELPEGKMKSREGTVVDADELLKEMLDTAEAATKEKGKVQGFSENELHNLYRIVSQGALKYFILKVDPKKKMLFDPKESIDLEGNTGPFIQYTHARIKSVLAKAGEFDHTGAKQVSLFEQERELIKLIYDFEAVVEEAGLNYSPALIANYIYEFTKLYNRFYHDLPILKEENVEQKTFRLQLSQSSAGIIANAMNMLGIEVPERM